MCKTPASGGWHGVDWPGDAPGLRAGTDHENRVPERIDDIERAPAPRFILRRAPDLHTSPRPLRIVRVCVVDLQRYAGVPAVPRHRAIERQADASALHAEE